MIMEMVTAMRKTSDVIKPVIKHVIEPSRVKVKSMQIFERTEDTLEVSRLRLELRQATLKGAGYLFLYFFIMWVVLPGIPIANSLQEARSVLNWLVSLTISTITFALLGTAELMKIKWLLKVLRKRDPPNSAA